MIPHDLFTVEVNLRTVYLFPQILPSRHVRFGEKRCFFRPEPVRHFKYPFNFSSFRLGSLYGIGGATVSPHALHASLMGSKNVRRTHSRMRRGYNETQRRRTSWDDSMHKWDINKVYTVFALYVQICRKFNRYSLF